MERHLTQIEIDELTGRRFVRPDETWSTAATIRWARAVMRAHPMAKRIVDRATPKETTPEGEATRLAALEAAAARTAHTISVMATAETGVVRRRLMTAANRLNAALGRAQSSHGDQFDAAGNVIHK